MLELLKASSPLSRWFSVRVSWTSYVDRTDGKRPCSYSMGLGIRQIWPETSVAYFSNGTSAFDDTFRILNSSMAHVRSTSHQRSLRRECCHSSDRKHSCTP
jgi:hypothetical protein